jgi:hypothetical protein
MGSSHRRTLVTDDFNRSNGALGANWADYHTPTGGATATALTLVSNRVRPLGAGNLPTIVGVGTPGQGTGNVTPGLPAGWQAGDLFILAVETANETVATPSGWTAATNSPQSQTFGAVTRLTAFYRRAVGGDTAPTISDPGDHAVAAILGLRGVVASGDPQNITAGGHANFVNSIVVPGATTTVDNCLVVVLVTDHSANLTLPRYTAVSNADLANLTKRLDTAGGNGGADGGGGLGMFTGDKATAGTYGTTSITFFLSTVGTGYLTLAIVPAASTTNDGEGLTGVALPDNQWAQITVPTLGPGSTCGIGCRWADAPTYSGYLARVTQGTPNTLALIVYDEPTPTTLGTSATAPAAGDTLRIEAFGTVVTVYLNDVPVITVSDSTFATGTAFLVARNPSDASQTELDDFAAGDWVAVTETTLEPAVTPWMGTDLAINAKTMVALAVADTPWTGQALSIASRVLLDPAATPWTGQDLVVNGQVRLVLDPASTPWTGQSLTISQRVHYLGFLMDADSEVF